MGKKTDERYIFQGLALAPPSYYFAGNVANSHKFKIGTNEKKI